MSKQGGYNCEFVSEPPESIQAKCSLCSLIVRDPCQATCCGKVFCEACVSSLTSCPSCQKSGLTTFPDKRLHFSLLELKVYCVNKKDGCEWTGEFGALEDHLNLKPNQENVSEGCSFVAVDCKYHYVGCGVKVPRKLTAAHLKENVAEHLAMFEEGYKSQCSLLKETTTRVDRLEQENRQLQIQHSSDMERLKLDIEWLKSRESGGIQQIRASLDQLRFHQCIAPFQVFLDQFSFYKQKKLDWSAPPFYTHPRGYKMSLRVTAFGLKPCEGTHVTVGIYLMQGEYDDCLLWPFRGSITIQLLSQIGDNQHHSLSVAFDGRSDAFKRLLDQEISDQGWGKAAFIAHSDLTPRYLVNDRLHFQVVTQF